MSFVLPPLPELKKVLKSLVSTAEVTMGAVHDLQNASINANHSKNTLPLRELFSRMRRSLYDEWTNVETFLRSCYDFSDKVVKLNESRGEFDTDEVQEYLQGLTAQLVQLRTACGKLLSQHAEIARAFDQSALQLNQLLSHPAAARNNLDHIVPPTSKAPMTREFVRAPIRRTTGDLTVEDHEFVQSSLRAAYPDGHTAISSISASLSETHNSLTTIYQLLGVVHAMANPVGPIPSVTNVERDDQDWVNLRDYILNIIPFFPRVRDAITIERSRSNYPKGEPSFSPPRSSHATSEKTLLTTRHTYRQTSNQEDIPKPRWRSWLRRRR